MQEPIYDKEVKKISVICSQCALARNGLTTQNWVHLDLWTNCEGIDGLDAAVVRYLYNPNIDTEYEVKSESSNPLLLLPSKERAIVEYVLCEKWRDEGTLIEALKNYQEQFWNDRIYEVADHFGLARETLDYWLEEARNDCEI